MRTTSEYWAQKQSKVPSVLFVLSLHKCIGTWKSRNAIVIVVPRCNSNWRVYFLEVHSPARRAFEPPMAAAKRTPIQYVARGHSLISVPHS